VSLITTLKPLVEAAWPPTREPEISRTADQRVFVVEEVAANRWKIIDARIETEHIQILDAYTLDPEVFERDMKRSYSILDPQHGDEITLVPDSRQSVCRLLEMPPATQRQLEQMVSLRLEVELPYPPEQSTWVCERLPVDTAGTANVVLLAMGTEPIAQVEARLKASGMGLAGIDFAPGGLAELAALDAPDNAPVAIAKIDRGRALLAVVCNGALCYARHARLDEVAIEGNGNFGQWLDSLAQDLKQSLLDYAMRTGHGAPGKLLITGDILTDKAHCAGLEERLNMPATMLQCPDVLRLDNPMLDKEALIAEYAVGLGVLISLDRRDGGYPTTTPPLRQKTAASALTLQRASMKLLLVNLVLFLALGLSVFMVQKARMGAADRFAEKSKSFVAAMDKVQEEVNILKYEEGQKRPLLEVLMALSEILPSELKVESINIDRKGKLLITGTTKSVEAVSDDVIEAINNSRLMKNPEFKGATKGKKNLTFTLSCELGVGTGGAQK
jgi:hypothetical protein